MRFPKRKADLRHPQNQRKAPNRFRFIENLEQCETRTLLTTFFSISGSFQLNRYSPNELPRANSSWIRNLGPNETIQGLDFRPVDGRLYALTTDANQIGRIYTIPTSASSTSADAALVSTVSVPVTGTRFGLDFDPVADTLRVVSDTGLNLQVDVSTGGATVDTMLAYVAGDPNFGRAPNVVGSAYLNNFAGASTTTLYQIDTKLDVLAIQAPAGEGTLTTLGALGVDASALIGFDIRTVGTMNLGYATLAVGDTTNLYQINLDTGAATFVAPAFSGLSLLAIAPEGFQAASTGLAATFTGDMDGGTLILDQAGGLLRHNQFDLGVPGYVSAFDFDSSRPGEQTLRSTDPAGSVTCFVGAGSDHFILGSVSAPFSSLVGSFSVRRQDRAPYELTLDDHASTVPQNIGLFADRVTGFAASVTIESSTSDEMTLRVNGGQGNDTFAWSRPTEHFRATTALNGGGGADTLNVDAAGIQTIANTTSLNFPIFRYYTVIINHEEFERINIDRATGQRLVPIPNPQTIHAMVGVPLVDAILLRFKDEDPGARASDFQATLIWGDGSTSAGAIRQDKQDPSLFSVLGTHRYTTAGQYLVSSTIIDMGRTSTLRFGDPEIGAAFSSPDATPHPLVASPPSLTVTIQYIQENPVYVNTAVDVMTAPFEVTVTARLDAASDTGRSNQDGITRDTTPWFSGTSAPGSLVRIFHGTDPGTRRLLAEAVADSTGIWQAKAASPLADGLYASLVAEATATDGMTQATRSLAPVVVDTVGPQITTVAFRRLTGLLRVTFQDDQSGLDPDRLVDRANFEFLARVRGSRRARHLLIPPLTTATPPNPRDAQLVTLAFNNGRPIRAGQHRFLVRADGIKDVAGNALDGEYTGRFPSGNNLPGGDFVARLRRFREVVVEPETATTRQGSPSARIRELKLRFGHS